MRHRYCTAIAVQNSQQVQNILRRFIVQSFIGENKSFELNALCDTTPVEIWRDLPCSVWELWDTGVTFAVIIHGVTHLCQSRVVFHDTGWWEVESDSPHHASFYQLQIPDPSDGRRWDVPTRWNILLYLSCVTYKFWEQIVYFIWKLWNMKCEFGWYVLLMLHIEFAQILLLVWNYSLVWDQFHKIYTKIVINSIKRWCKWLTIEFKDSWYIFNKIVQRNSVGVGVCTPCYCIWENWGFFSLCSSYLMVEARTKMKFCNLS